MTMPARMHDDAAQNDILDAIGRIALLIATSRAKVVKGDLVELSHIETTVATLCERIRSAELNNKLIIDRLMRLQAELNPCPMISARFSRTVSVVTRICLHRPSPRQRICLQISGG